MHVNYQNDLSRSVYSEPKIICIRSFVHLVEYETCLRAQVWSRETQNDWLISSKSKRNSHRTNTMFLNETLGWTVQMDVSIPSYFAKTAHTERKWCANHLHENKHAARTPSTEVNTKHHETNDCDLPFAVIVTLYCTVMKKTAIFDVICNTTGDTNLFSTINMTP